MQRYISRSTLLRKSPMCIEFIRAIHCRHDISELGLRVKRRSIYSQSPSGAAAREEIHSLSLLYTVELAKPHCSRALERC